MVLSKSDPRRISPVTGSRDSSLSRAATDRARLILINETDSRSFVNPHQSKMLWLNGGYQSSRAILQNPARPSYASQRSSSPILRRKVVSRSLTRVVSRDASDFKRHWKN